MFGSKRRARRKAAVASAARAELLLDRLGRALDGDQLRRPGLFGTLRSMLFRARHQLAPFAVIGAVWLCGVGVGRDRGALVAVALAGAGVWWLLRRRHLRPVEMRYARWCLTAAAGWLTGVAVVGVGAPMPAVLLAAGVAAGWPWWRHHRIRRPALVVDDGPLLPEAIPARWAAHVACAGGPAEGARIYRTEQIANGERHLLQLVPGRQTLGLVQGRLPLVATGLRRPLAELVLDDDRDNDDPSLVQLCVVPRSPVKVTMPLTQPRFVDGAVLLGPYADTGDAPWRVYTDNSMWGGFLLGSPGSGKTRCEEVLCLTVRWLGNTAIIYIDGQAGASSPLLYRKATLSAGPDRAEAVLRAIERIMAMRQKYNVANELSGFTPPGPGGAPGALFGVLVVIDECHLIFHSDLAERWAHVARAGRKLGVGVVAADQYVDLKVFGGFEPLRSSLMAGNAIAMRTMSRSAKNMMPGLDLNPHELPALPGFGYTVAAGGTGRTAPFRCEYVPDAKDKAAGLYPGVRTLEEWFDVLPDCGFDPISATAAGELVTHRDQLAAAELAALRVELAAASSGRVIRPPAPEPAAAGEPKVSAIERILAALRGNGGRMGRGSLIEATELDVSTATKALTKGVKDGLVSRDARGEYSIPV